jgi:glutamate-1-semialdehyde 2,1-aminomutase
LNDDWLKEGSRSHALHVRAREVFVGANTRQQVWLGPYPPYIERGEGSYIFDVEGKRYLDFTNNLGVLIHGHAHPEITRVAEEQIRKGTCFALPTPEELPLAELLCERIESIEKVRFINTGSEAVAAALKAARAYTGRYKIAKLEGVYHGSYDYAEISNYSNPENWGNDPNSVPTNAGTPPSVLEDVVVIPGNDVAASKRILDDHADELAAVIIDPVPPRNGMVPLRADYAKMVREWTRQNDSLLIYDEVIALRFGYHGAQGRFDGDPDLTAMGKIIGGGFPVGAIGGRDKFMQVVNDKAQTSGTFSGNPLTMSAGIASMSLLTKDVFDNLEQCGNSARVGLQKIIDRHGANMQVVGTGSMFSIYPHKRDATNYRNYFRSTAENALVAMLHMEMLKRGVVLAPTCTGFISSVMGDTEIEQLCAVFEEALGAVGA